MTRRKSNKRALTLSLLSLLLCMAMLVGSTFAWFTDNASTSVNTIQAGTLDIGLYDNNTTFTKETSLEGKSLTFAKAEGAPANEAVLFEPGAKYMLKQAWLRNDGNLHAKYKVVISGIDGSSELAQVLDVYVANEKVGTLAALVANGGTVKEGTIAPETTATFGTIELEMQTSAGNEYQGKSLAGIAITVVATQAAHEYDSTDNTYDANAEYPEIANDVFSFQAAVARCPDGGTIIITAPMTITGMTDGDLTNTGKTINIDFNGTTATGANGNIAFRARGNSVANLSNGTIVANADTWSAVSAAGNDTGKAVANISNMTLSNSKENGNCVRGFDNSEINIQNTTINSSVGGCVEMANGILNIQSGTFTQTGKTTGEYDANSMNVAVNSGGTANIYGGTYTSGTYGLCVFNSGGTMNVYGGTFKADKAVLIANEKAADAVADCVFNIYGGSFDGKIWMEAGAVLNIYEGTFANTTLTLEQFKAYVAEGSTVTEANGVFTVTK